MITKEIAEKLHIGQVLYHETERNADGTALRCRVNGKCKTWKRDLSRFKLPVKHGVNNRFYIDSELWMSYGCTANWLLYDPTEVQKLPIEVGLRIDTPVEMVYDALLEAGREQDAKYWKAECERLAVIQFAKNLPASS